MHNCKTSVDTAHTFMYHKIHFTKFDCLQHICRVVTHIYISFGNFCMYGVDDVFDQLINSEAYTL